MARKKKVEIDPEQRIREKLVHDLKKIEDNLHIIPEPLKVLQNGTPIRIGNLKDAVISNVYFDGKAYEITYAYIDNNYGNPIRHENQKRIVKWVDVRTFPTSETSLTQNEDLQINYSQRTMEDLFGKVYHFGVDFNPDYQRDYVWTLEDKVSLVDSIYNHVDIGKFVFIRLGYADEYLYEVLDGKQRLRAILDFYEDRFQYKGFYYSELSSKDQNHFEGYNINVGEVSNITNEQKLRYFLKLNTGGRAMGKEHLDKVRKMLEQEIQ